MADCKEMRNGWGEGYTWSQTEGGIYLVRDGERGMHGMVWYGERGMDVNV